MLGSATMQKYQKATVQNVAEEEQERIECLILVRGNREPPGC